MANLHEQLAKLVATRDAIQSDYETWVTKRKDEKEKEKARGFITQAALDKIQADIDLAEKIYKPDIDRLNAEIELVEMAIEADEKETLAQAEAQAAQVESELKESLYSAWLESGGRPSEFEKAWPDLKKAEMMRRTQTAMAERPVANGPQIFHTTF